MRYLVIILLCLGLFSCNDPSNENTSNVMEPHHKVKRVDVIYFHDPEHCHLCPDFDPYVVHWMSLHHNKIVHTKIYHVDITFSRSNTSYGQKLFIEGGIPSTPLIIIKKDGEITNILTGNNLQFIEYLNQIDQELNK